MRGRLAAFRQTDRIREASASIRRHLGDFLRGFADSFDLTVASFASLPGEPALLPLVTTFDDIAWAFPRVEGGHLEFYRVETVSELVRGAYGIREPASLPERKIRDTGTDIFCVPGLAFDPVTGARLGRGKGHYDRALARRNFGAVRVGVAFDCQLATVPVEPHDLPMHLIVTESGPRWMAK